MKQNLGAVDRVLRFALAFWWLGPFAPQLPAVWSIIIVVVGWIALAESFLGWCWLHGLMGLKSR